MVLYDTYNRPVSNIRISLTSDCNLNCIYCHREGECEPEEPMSVADISEIIRVAIKFGVKSIKFTGGEPLLRRDITEILKNVPEGIETSLTTNGTLLAPIAKDLKEAGLSRVNISLDSLDHENYKKIAGHDRLDNVLAGIDAAVKAGLVPVKLNVVLLKGINEDEINDFISFVRERENLILQIIELMDFVYCPYHADLADIEKEVSEKSKMVITRRMHHRKKYCFEGAEIEFVRPLHNSEFCKNCNRLRVTSDGKLKPCLLRTDNLIDIRGKRGLELEELFKKAVSIREPFYT